MAFLITEGLGGGGLLLTRGLGGPGTTPVVTFFVISARPIGPLGIRMSFSSAPMAFDPAGPHDALNPTLYALTGPAAATVVGAAPVTGDPLSIDVYVGAPLPAGTWTVTVDAAVQDLSAAVVGFPNTASFAIALTPPGTPVAGGAIDEGTLRRHLNPALVGDAWDHLILAVEGDADHLVGDAYVAQVARQAYDQLFLATASGTYLDRRAAEVGARRPDGVGLRDEPFRRLALTLANELITDNALHDVLEIFYGADAVRATLTSGTIEPFALQDGDDLVLVFGSGRQVTVLFDQLAFARVGQAMAVEVAAAIDRALHAAGVNGIAAVVPDAATGAGRVRVYADARGTSSAVRVLGGRAQVALRFPDDLFPPGQVGPFGAWIVVPSPDVAGRLRLTSDPATPYDLSLVEMGDRVLIYGREFPATLSGAHDILAVSVTFPGGVRSQWIEIDGTSVSTAVTQIAETSVVFLRPTIQTIHAQRFRSYVTSVDPSGLEAVLPATSRVVERANGEAGYLASAAPVAVLSLDRDASGLVTLITATPHGLLVGGRLIADGLVVAPALPALSAGAPSGTLGASHL